MATSRASKNGPTQLSMFSLEELRASPSRLPDFARAWLIPGATSPSPILPLLTSIAPNGWSGRTSPAFCRAREDGTLVPSSEGWGNSGMGSPTECLTLSTVEWTDFHEPSPSVGGVCSLSEILETGDVPRRYFLSARACRGILRRAEKRGKVLPIQLHQALEQVAGALSEPAKPEGKTRSSASAPP